MPVRLIQSAILLLCASAIPAVAELAESDWPHYHGDPTGSHYSQLGQITRENVASLKVAWTYNSLGAQTESQSGRRRKTRRGALAV
jgi:quinoprotein glucose dehydrogenase